MPSRRTFLTATAGLTPLTVGCTASNDADTPTDSSTPSETATHSPTEREPTETPTPTDEENDQNVASLELGYRWPQADGNEVGGQRLTTDRDAADVLADVEPVGETSVADLDAFLAETDFSTRDVIQITTAFTDPTEGLSLGTYAHDDVGDHVITTPDSFRAIDADGPIVSALFVRVPTQPVEETIATVSVPGHRTTVTVGLPSDAPLRRLDEPFRTTTTQRVRKIERDRGSSMKEDRAVLVDSAADATSLEFVEDDDLLAFLKSVDYDSNYVLAGRYGYTAIGTQTIPYRFASNDGRLSAVLRQQRGAGLNSETNGIVLCEVNNESMPSGGTVRIQHLDDEGDVQALRTVSIESGMAD